MQMYTITFSMAQLLVAIVVVYAILMYIIFRKRKGSFWWALLKLVLTSAIVFGLIAYVFVSKKFDNRIENIILAMSYIAVGVFVVIIREVKLMAKRKMKQRMKGKEQEQQDGEE